MKKLLLQTIACCAVLLPFTQLEAKTYGGFRKGKVFTLKVSEKIVTKTVGTKIIKKAKVPADVVKLRKGQLVKFKIGTKGKLVFKGRSIPFKSGGGVANVYYKVITGAKVKADTAEIFKNSKKRPTGAALSFVRTTYAGLDTTVVNVSYLLKRRGK